MSHALVSCAFGTNHLQSAAWGAYFTMKYARFLYRAEFQNCIQSIVGNDPEVIAYRFVPTVFVNNTLLHLAPGSRITNASNQTDVDAALRTIGTNFGANSTKTAAYPTLVQDIINIPLFSSYTNDLISRLDGAFPQATDRTNYLNLVQAANNIIQH